MAPAATHNGRVTVFACRECGHHITADVGEVPLPPLVVDDASGSSGFLPPRMARGDYANSEELGGLVLSPDDVAGASLHPDSRRRNGCCRLDGLDGPNLVCASCGSEVATQQSDCWSQQQITILPDAVRPVSPPGRSGQC
jgi:hypothetical protein